MAYSEADGESTEVNSLIMYLCSTVITEGANQKLQGRLQGICGIAETETKVDVIQIFLFTAHFRLTQSAPYLWLNFIGPISGKHLSTGIWPLGLATFRDY